MIDFPTLYPSLVKYLPNWLERFYPSMTQFAKGDGYPCGNQGVFIPKDKKCWMHPKTGQRLKKPLTYQMYQEAKVKSQRSRTEKGRTALERREQELRQKNKKGIKKNNLIGDGTHESVPKNAQEYYEMMVKKGKPITMEEAEYTVRSIKDWTQGNYSSVRKLQIQGRTSAEADDLTKFIKNSTPYKGKIYRGVVSKNEADAMERLTKSGDFLKQEAHSSWSSSREKALEFAQMTGGTRQQPVLIETVNKTGASIKNLSASSFADEFEVLVPKGATHKILSIVKEADIIIVKTIEVVK